MFELASKRKNALFLRVTDNISSRLMMWAVFSQFCLFYKTVIFCLYKVYLMSLIIIDCLITVDD